MKELAFRANSTRASESSSAGIQILCIDGVSLLHAMCIAPKLTLITSVSDIFSTTPTRPLKAGRGGAPSETDYLLNKFKFEGSNRSLKYCHGVRSTLASSIGRRWRRQKAFQWAMTSGGLKLSPAAFPLMLF